MPTMLPAADASPALTDRLALRILQAGAVLSVLVAAPYHAFELDRFYVPKEFVLHATAALTALLMLRRAATLTFSRVDLWLVLFLLFGLASALLAPNGWNAARALALSASGTALFWSARGLGSVGLSRPLLRALALAVVVAAVTSLLQAYGLRTDFFSLNRSPGGTLGNRNSIGHLVALGFPLVALGAIGARRALHFVLASTGGLLCVAALVLTRSRAAWLAMGLVLLVLFVTLLIVAFRHRAWRLPVRFALLLGAMALGAAAALLLPNALRWTSSNPYADTALGVTNYREGSGQGRLMQYQRSLVMLLHHPLLGVGPGNWTVVYPRHAAPRDPSMSGAQPGRTMNPWPSSDVVAMVTERGVLGLLALVLAAGLLALRAVRALWQADAPVDAAGAGVLLALSAGVLACGLFDAVVLLPWPMLIAAAAAGALWPAEAPPREPAPGVAAPPIEAVPERRPRRWPLVAAMAVLVAASAGAALQSARSTAAMAIFSSAGSRASLERAARLDPGNYRVRMRLAQRGPRENRCDHARAAHALYPHAEAAKRLAARCR